MKGSIQENKLELCTHHTKMLSNQMSIIGLVTDYWVLKSLVIVGLLMKLGITAVCCMYGFAELLHQNHGSWPVPDQSVFLMTDTCA